MEPTASTEALFPEPAPKVRARVPETPLRLGERPITDRLVPVADRGDASPPAIRDTVGALRPGRKLYLVLRDLRTEAQPGVLYSLYLDLPAGSSPGKGDPHLAGSLSFFNARPGNQGKSDRFVSFDVTALVKSLHAQGRLADPLTLTIIPDSRPSQDASPTVGEITLVEQ